MFRFYGQRAPTGAVIDPVRPRTANDRFFWRKLFDRNPDFPIVSDKLAVRHWLTDHGIDVATPRVLWCGTNARTIPDEVWSADAVLKPNHAAGMVDFLPVAPPDRDLIARRANNYLDVDHHLKGGQWGYKDIPRRLFVEHRLPADACGLTEIKLYTFGARIVNARFIYNRAGPGRRDDTFRMTDKGHLVRIGNDDATKKAPAGRPPHPVLPSAIRVAEQIGRHFDHVRVDFYVSDDTLYLGELTLYTHAGCLPDSGWDPDHPMASTWDLRDSWFLRTRQTGWRELYRRALCRWLDRVS